MIKQEKINVIYEKMANKELSFGCKIEDILWNSLWRVVFSDSSLNTWNIETDIGMKIDYWYSINIIWHQVMIGDVLNYKQETENWGSNHILDLLTDWTLKTLPIEDQNQECIDYVYNLITIDD